MIDKIVGKVFNLLGGRKFIALVLMFTALLCNKFGENNMTIVVLVYMGVNVVESWLSGLGKKQG